MKKYYLHIVIVLLLLFRTVQIGAEITSEDSSNVTIKLIENDRELAKNTVVHYSTAAEDYERPLKVRLFFPDGSPAVGYEVIFSVIGAPVKSEGTKITPKIVSSDSMGFAETKIHLGSKGGVYQFSARILGSTSPKDIVYMTIDARKRDWLFLLISGLAGGLGLFLYGINLMSEGMKKSAGSAMRSLLGTMTSNRFIAVLVGIFITMIVQSSSATTVMLVGFVQAGLMSFTQTIGIIFGATIGTTITVQLIALKLTDYALLIIAAGFLFNLFGKTKKQKNIGQTILGFGILFFGMYIMSEAVYPLRTFEKFITLLTQLENPILGILVGTLFTALIQSSGAFIGILIVLASHGLISLDAAIPLLFGANIGTSITALLASINTNRDARRVALAHAIFKILGVIIFAWWIPVYAEWIRELTSALNPMQELNTNTAFILPHQIANAHTVFNVILTLVFLPFTKIFAKFIFYLIPEKDETEETPYKTKFLEDKFISTPSLALNLAKAETLEMAVKVKEITEKIIIPFFENKDEIFSEIKEAEKEIDYLQFQTSRYLAKISQQDLEEGRIEESFQILQCSAEFEQIADLVSSRMRTLAKKRIKHNLSFSEEGAEELKKFHLRSVKQIARAIDVFREFNLERGKKLEVKYQKYKAGEIDLKRAHFERLRQEVDGALQTNEMHLELIDIFLRINRHCATIGRIMMGDIDYEIDEDEKKNLSDTVIEE